MAPRTTAARAPNARPELALPHHDEHDTQHHDPCLPGVPLLLGLAPDTLRDFAHALTAEDLEYLVRSVDELRALGAQANAVQKVLRDHLATILEYEGDGEKATRYGRWHEGDRTLTYSVSLVPGERERRWDQAALAHFVAAVEKNPVPEVRALADKHFRRVIECRNIRNARAAFDPLRGEIGLSLVGCYEETQKPASVDIKVSGPTAPEEP